MKQRSPIAVFLLPFVTFGIYAIYWEVSTKNELKARGADIPTAWLLIVPFVNYYWLWKYSQGTELVTKGKFSAPVTFLLLFFVGIIGMAILQDSYNKLDATPVAAGAPGGQPFPDDSFGGGGFGAPSNAPETPVTPVTPAAPTPATPTVTPVSFDQPTPVASPTPVAAAPVVPDMPIAPSPTPADNVITPTNPPQTPPTA